MNKDMMMHEQQIIDFDGIKLSVASPEHILDWSQGEVTKPETINYRTQKPERDGLFCEKIFGPTKDWQCYCGKYKGIRYKGIECDKCGVLVTRSIVRRERMAHIALVVPVAHIWFLRGTPSPVSLLLNVGIRDLERVVYFANFIVTEVDEDAKSKALSELKNDYETKHKEILKKYEIKTAKLEAISEEAQNELNELETYYTTAKTELTNLAVNQLLPESRYRELNMKFGQVFRAGIGAEALQLLLEKIDLKKLAKSLRSEANDTAGQKMKKALKRLKIVEGMIKSGIEPSSMITTNLPVIPPDLRPMVQLDGGRFAASDLNDLYRRVINRNNRLKKLFALDAPEVICRNEKRMLQEAVDALIDNNARRDRAVSAAGSRKKLKSLTDLLKGKQGRFRQNLLGKRVDYSGRSVIVIGPHLKLDQCGIPKMMALELFKPFVIGQLIEKGIAHNVKSASRMIERARTEVWDTLDEVIAGKYVLLNRAPTLHRLGIQAFKPLLIEGKAIQLHPMVCAAFNADFDGDQMAVHVPLSEAAQAEAREIMLSKHNLLKPSSGEPVVQPSQDVVLGCFFLTSVKNGLKGEGKAFNNINEATMAYQAKSIELRASIKLRLDGQIIDTTVGRMLFNEILPEDMTYVNDTLNKSKLQKIMAAVFAQYGQEVTADLVDAVKDLGFKYATQSGISIGMDDLVIPKDRNKLVTEAEEKAIGYVKQYQQGLITNGERYARTVEAWKATGEQIESLLADTLEESESTLYDDLQSGARASIGQINKMSGMLGLMLSPAGKIIELPVRSNYKDGLGVLEYFISTHGARKGLTDTALRTSESGYLTRRLVDVAQDIVISENDCGDKEGYIMSRAEAIATGEDGLSAWIVGRTSMEKIVDPKSGETIIKKGALISDIAAEQVDVLGIEELKIRSIFKCKSAWGLCQKCYGVDLATGRQVRLGEAVGIMAAQSIGEPGTQLTMNTKHATGVGADITQGLPRVEEIFEARAPKGQAILSDIEGTVKIARKDKKQLISVTPADQKVTKYDLKDMKPNVKTGEVVTRSQLLAQSADGKKTIKAGGVGTVKVDKTQIILTHDSANTREYTVSEFTTIEVKSGDTVKVGQRLTEGSVNLQDMLKLQGEESVQRYVIDEVQAIYLSQGQTIAAKHIEVIIRQMFSRVRIEDPGDTAFIAGDVVSRAVLEEENLKAKDNKTKPATYEMLLMPITKISTSSDSWLSAASFQETTKVLISAAMRGKQDKLRGLKENVIIGRLIPVGTGFRDEEGKS
ncbi:MAG TPA: DNA-directed RNA polymerase subunit beta' [Candidatus Saccharibacteria bacterium]|nr:DNA-directed RNA polymerase subunit beta' [Candidatus Saccharibacteria bacterium]HMT39564.1 DNA-directed RNA polymerase subunit beta' [Candidatus Saccharibacteria bacterium]